MTDTAGYTSITPPPSSSPLSSINNPQVKRKRGRPPKKTPIDTQTMTTTPHVSMKSSMPTELSQATYSFQFAPVTTPKRKQRKSSNATPSPACSLSSSPPPLSAVPLVTPSHTQDSNNALGISFGEDDCISPDSLGAMPDLSTSAAHVDPSLIFQKQMSRSYSSPGFGNMQSLVSPVTPKTFGTIINSSPLYPGYSYDDENRPPPQSASHMHTQTHLSTHDLPQIPASKTTEENSSQHYQQQQLQSPLRTTNANASARRAIFERRNASCLSLSKSQSMRRLSAYDSGPLSAPIKPASMNRSQSLKRRVSLNITEGRASVVENDVDDDEEPPASKQSKLERPVAMTRTQTAPAYSKVSTIYDKANDYINDNARRMSLEQLFPELSPPAPHASTTPVVPSEPEQFASPNEESDEEEDDLSQEDARDALKQALERNSSTRSLDQYCTESQPSTYHTIPASSLSSSTSAINFHSNDVNFIHHPMQYQDFAMSAIY